MKELRIMGTRGIPAAHGGFETFAERLARFLTARGWTVTVYCQSASGPHQDDVWNGINRVHIPAISGAIGTIFFDLQATLHAARRPGAVLVLGYNTAVFNVILRAFGRKVGINMDGIEYQRQQYGRIARAWLRVNEWVALRTSHLIFADHPEIAHHLAGRMRKGAVVFSMPPMVLQSTLTASTR
jgi:hypothetical protein